MVRLLLLLVLIVIVARAFWRLFDGIVQGVTGNRQPPMHVSQQSVHMMRDPVCGTFVVPGRAVTMSEGHSQLYFCSASCRDQYQARQARPA